MEAKEKILREAFGESEVGRIHNNYPISIQRPRIYKAMEEYSALQNAELLEFLKELQRFVPSLSRLADDHLQSPQNCNKALAQIEVLITKHSKQ